MFQPDISLPYETAEFRQYSGYKTGGASVPVHWLVQYVPVSTVSAVRDWLHYFCVIWDVENLPQISYCD